MSSLTELRHWAGLVVIVSGAGRGLGREYALALGARGACVVVNELDASEADGVVREIVLAGGRAAASTASVTTGGAAIVQTALDAFGRVDAVINNAGILRDRALHNMTRAEYAAVLAVHLLGAAALTAAAWPHFQRQRFGRVVFTSSAAGIFGQFGQSNYGAAKLALVGLARALAREGAPFGIAVNAIAPLAATRMLATARAFAGASESLAPARIVPVVLALVAPECRAQGALVECAGGFVAQLALQRGRGVFWRSVHGVARADGDGGMADFAAMAAHSDALVRELSTWGDDCSASMPLPDGLDARAPDRLDCFAPDMRLHEVLEREVRDAALTAREFPLTLRSGSAGTTRAFEGQVVIVTGGAVGLGARLARLFCALGAAVVVQQSSADAGAGSAGSGEPRAGRGETAAEALVVELEAAGGRALACTCDARADGESIVAAAMAAFGRVDVVVAAATGASEPRPFEAISGPAFERTVSAGLTCSWELARAAWPVFRAQGAGTVVLVSSMDGVCGTAGHSAASAAAAGVLGLASVLAAEGLPHGVRVNTVLPVSGSMRPSETTALVVAWLASRACTAHALWLEIGAGWFGPLRWKRSRSVVLASDDPVELRARWAGELDDWSHEHASFPDGSMDAVATLLATIAARRKPVPPSKL